MSVSSPPPDDRAPAASRRLGTGRNVWDIGPDRVDLAPPPPPARTVALNAEPSTLSVDLHRSAAIVVDMQNNFCAPGGLTDQTGVDIAPARAPIAPLNRLLPRLREAGVPVIWLNWGNRPDRANLPPATLYPFARGESPGIGGQLRDGKGPVLIERSWSAAIVDELAVAPDDLHVDKFRASGFWDTPLDSILRNLDVRTLFFAGVNLDICVYHTLADASFLGYNCILVEDCCATTAPQFCIDATLWNIRRVFGFVSTSDRLIDAVTGG